MFTGIIQEIGIIQKIDEQNGVKSFTIEAPLLTPLQKIGSSISVDGTCLTVVSATNQQFTVEAIPETLARTIAGSYSIGQRLNLEPSLKVGDSLDGHFVSGHIDCKGTVDKIEEDGDTKIITIKFPLMITEEQKNIANPNRSAGLAKYFAFKGSVTVNGVSLTISKLNTDSFEVNIIPHTQKVTNLGELKETSEVNIEVDLIARYLENLLKDKEKEASYEFLQKRGFI